jgi:hypothetical protein
MELSVGPGWRGTAEAFTVELERAVEYSGLSVEAPTLRTVRSWRSKGLLTKSDGSRFGFRQLLEGLATAVLLENHWSTAAIADLLPTLTVSELEANLASEASGAAAGWIFGGSRGVFPRALRRRYADEAAEDAVVLLAQGTLRQYDRILTGREIVRQDDGLPPELYSAMCKIGRLYIEEGQTDRAACVHDVLARARHPLGSTEWGVGAFSRPEFRFRDAVLIDPDLGVPTPDCTTVASIVGGFGEDNVIEHRLHATLLGAAERLGSRRRHAAYTAVRELAGRRSLVVERELADYLVKRDLVPLQEAVVGLFDPVPDAWLIGGRAHRCAHCGTLMRPHSDARRNPDGACPLRQCRGKRPARVGERLDPGEGDLLVARPQILTYWTGPAIDELAIYDEARRRGLEAELYPESDLCDVSIGGYAIGIDAKSYSSPVSLALRLSRGIGGLVNYRRRIVAVGDELVAANPDYVSVVRASIDRSGDAATLEIVPASEVLSALSSGVDA